MIVLHEELAAPAWSRHPVQPTTCELSTRHEGADAIALRPYASDNAIVVVVDTVKIEQLSCFGAESPCDEHLTASESNKLTVRIVEGGLSTVVATARLEHQFLDVVTAVIDSNDAVHLVIQERIAGPLATRYLRVVRQQSSRSDGPSQRWRTVAIGRASRVQTGHMCPVCTVRRCEA